MPKGKIFHTITFCSLFLCVLFVNAGRAYASGGNGRIKVVTSFYPMYIMARNVARDVPGVSVENLTPPLTGCLHDYALTTSDMKKIAEAQVFVANGAGMESFLDKIVAQYPDLAVIRASEGIPLIEGEGDEGDNPHVWVSISDAIAEVKNIGSAMEKADPAHKALYEKNTAEYAAKLESLRKKMHAELAPYRGRKIVTFHEAFPYFAREFGLKIAAVVEREPGSQPSARELADTIDLIKKSGINALFSEPQYPSAAARTLHDVGVRVRPAAAQDLTLSFEIDNLTDDATTDVAGFPLPGRSLRCGAAWTF